MPETPKTDKLRSLIQQHKANPPAPRPAPPPKPQGGKPFAPGKGGKPKKKGGKGKPLPPGVVKQDKRFQAKPRLPAGAGITCRWDGSVWQLTMSWSDPNTPPVGVTHTAPKLFGGLHELDDKFRAALAAAGSKPEDKP